MRAVPAGDARGRRRTRDGRPALEDHDRHADPIAAARCRRRTPRSARARRPWPSQSKHAGTPMSSRGGLDDGWVSGTASGHDRTFSERRRVPSRTTLRRPAGTAPVLLLLSARDRADREHLERLRPAARRRRQPRRWECRGRARTWVSRWGPSRRIAPSCHSPPRVVLHAVGRRLRGQLYPEIPGAPAAPLVRAGPACACGPRGPWSWEAARGPCGPYYSPLSAVAALALGYCCCPRGEPPLLDTVITSLAYADPCTSAKAATVEWHSRTSMPSSRFVLASARGCSSPSPAAPRRSS